MYIAIIGLGCYKDDPSSPVLADLQLYNGTLDRATLYVDSCRRKASVNIFKSNI